MSGQERRDHASAEFTTPTISPASTTSTWRASPGDQNAENTKFERLGKALADLHELAKELNKVFPHIAGRSDPSLDDARAIVEGLRHVAAAPRSSRLALNHPAWVNDLSQIETGVAQGRGLQKKSAEVTALFRDKAWTVDTAPLVAILRKVGPSLLRWLTKRYRRAQAELRALCRTRPPTELEDQVRLLEKLHDAQEIRRAFVKHGAFLSAALGPIWNEFLTDWDKANALTTWTRHALTLVGRERIVEMAARSEDPDLIGKFADRLEALLRRAAASFAAVVGDVEVPDLLAGMADHDAAPLSTLCQTLSTAMAAYSEENRPKHGQA